MALLATIWSSRGPVIAGSVFVFRMKPLDVWMMSSLVEGVNDDHASAMFSLVVPSSVCREYANVNVGRIISCILFDVVGGFYLGIVGWILFCVDVVVVGLLVGWVLGDVNCVVCSSTSADSGVSTTEACDSSIWCEVLACPSWECIFFLGCVLPVGFLVLALCFRLSWLTGINGVSSSSLPSSVDIMSTTSSWFAHLFVRVYFQFKKNLGFCLVSNSSRRGLSRMFYPLVYPLLTFQEIFKLRICRYVVVWCGLFLCYLWSIELLFLHEKLQFLGFLTHGGLPVTRSLSLTEL